MNTTIRLCHLYPDLLNLYGDRGNILSLKRRAQWRDISLEVLPVSLDENFDPRLYDMVFLGGGQDAEQNLLRKDFVEKKGAAVKEAVDMEKIFLCICGGYQMMGRYYEEHNGERIDCLGAIDVWTKGEKERFVGDTAYQSELFPGPDGIFYGFENHGGRTYLGEGVKPLAKVLTGSGNNGEDKTEGAIYKNVYCTYSHGSFLPKNPLMTDFLLELALRSRFGEAYSLPPLSMELEMEARKSSPAYGKY